MKTISKLIVAGILTLGVANANDIMVKSMTKMDQGMNLIQKGFMHNSIDTIREGIRLVEEGNLEFSDEKTIAQYLPADKKHMVNVAENQAKRITLDTNLMGLRT